MSVPLCRCLCAVPPPSSVVSARGWWLETVVSGGGRPAGGVCAKHSTPWLVWIAPPFLWKRTWKTQQSAQGREGATPKEERGRTEPSLRHSVPSFMLREGRPLCRLREEGLPHREEETEEEGDPFAVEERRGGVKQKGGGGGRRTHAKSFAPFSVGVRPDKSG